MVDNQNNDYINQEDNINAFEYEKEFEKKLEELENKLKDNKDFENLVTTSLDYYKQLSDIKVDELMMKENERLLKLAYGIYYEEAERSDEERMYVHEGVSCSKCGIKSIIGTRYLCSVCEYFNLCPLCEKLNFYEGEYHDHDFIKIRKKDDLNKFNCDYKFEIELKNNEVEKHEDKNDKYKFFFKNTGNEDWPQNTYIKCITTESNCDFEEKYIGGLKIGKTKEIELNIKNIIFSQREYCRCVITLYVKDQKQIKFISPFEIHFIEKKKNELQNKDNNI